MLPGVHELTLDWTGPGLLDVAEPAKEQRCQFLLLKNIDVA